jgi:hypothetical protein
VAVSHVEVDDQLRAKVQPIVERTVADAGLDLTVRDPLALRLVASLLSKRGGDQR